MAGNSEIFKRANVLMKQGHDRKQAFAIAYDEAGKTVKKAVKKNPVSPLVAYDVYLHGELIDTVFYQPSYSIGEIRDSLVNHDGYDPEIVVKKERVKTVLKNPAKRAVKRKTRAVTQKAAVSYVNRPSQITKKSPTKRLRVRRTKNLRVPVGVFPNPIPRGSVDSVYAQEIFLFGQNDGDLYRQRTTYMIDNLAKKYAAGKYNETLALKMWRIWADEADKRYNKEYVGQSAGFLTNVPTRDLIAQKARDYYFEHVVQESAKFAKTKTRKNPVSEKTTKREKRGLFEQPEFPFRVESSTDGNKWRAEGSFRTEMIAREYARALDRKSGGRVWIRVTE